MLLMMSLTSCAPYYDESGVSINEVIAASTQAETSAETTEKQEVSATTTTITTTVTETTAVVSK